MESFCILFVFFPYRIMFSFVLFLLVTPNPVAFLLNVTSTVMFWMSACQSILCTVHLTWSLCYPDGSFPVCCCGCVVDRWTSNLLRQCSPHDMYMCAYLFEDLFVVSGCAWLSGRQSIPTKIPQKTKRTAVNWHFDALLQFCHFSVCCYVLLSHFHESEWCDFSLQ